jgi:predicted RNA-binding Zn-ribbon protein involved in translation (DUF1610 family)
MKLVTVYSSRDALEAHFLAGLLKSNDIPAVVTGEDASLGAYLPGLICVDVRDEDLNAAKLMVERLASGAPPNQPGAPWTCTNCGEQIEGQFSECWNCQAPHPQAGETAPSREPANPFVPIDLPCITCGYNLRALPVDQLCPECGHPIYASLFDMLHQELTAPDRYEIFRQNLQPCLDAVQDKFGFPIEAIIFVLSEWPSAMESVVRGSGEVNDDAILSALCARATEFVGSRAAAERTLARWKFDSPDNLRRLVAALRNLQLLSGH